MKKSVTIIVTAQDIKKGEKKSCSHCPIARAGQRVIKKNVTVGDADLGYDDYEARLPQKAIKFIMDFDRNIPVKPFSFKITLKKYKPRKIK